MDDSLLVLWACTIAASGSTCGLSGLGYAGFFGARAPLLEHVGEMTNRCASGGKAPIRLECDCKRDDGIDSRII